MCVPFLRLSERAVICKLTIRDWVAKRAGIALSLSMLSLNAIGQSNDMLGSQVPVAGSMALSDNETFNVEVVLGRTRYMSVERTSTGSITNQENGSLPNVSLTGRWQGTGWFGEFQMGLARDDIAYQGYSQLGIPLNTTTALTMTQGGGVMGHRWHGTNGMSWRISAGAERLQVRRSILPSLGSLPLREILTSTRVVAGVTWQQEWPHMALGQIALPLSLSAGVDVLRAVRSRIDVDSLGLYDPITLQPAQTTDWRLALKTKVVLLPGVVASVAWTQERFTPGGSVTEVWRRGGVAAAGVRYPGSQQRLQTLAMGVSLSF